MNDGDARLARRYPPPRLPRAVMVGLFAAVSVVGLAWLVWAALVHASPPVSAQVAAYEVVSDTTMKVTMTVQRLRCCLMMQPGSIRREGRRL